MVSVPFTDVRTRASKKSGSSRRRAKTRIRTVSRASVPSPARGLVALPTRAKCIPARFALAV